MAVLLAGCGEPALADASSCDDWAAASEDDQKSYVESHWRQKLPWNDLSAEARTTLWRVTSRVCQTEKLKHAKRTLGGASVLVYAAWWPRHCEWDVREPYCERLRPPEAV